MIDLSALGKSIQPDVPDDKPMMRFVPNSELDQREEEQRKAAMKTQSSSTILGLVQHIRKAWVANKQAKQEVERTMLEALRQRKGEYKPGDLRKIQASGGSEVFINITNVKTRGVEAWLEEALIPEAEKPWSLEPTPIPDLPSSITDEITARMNGEYQNVLLQSIQLGTMAPSEIPDMVKNMEREIVKEIKAQAKEDATTIENEIEDELTEGNYYEALRDVIKDISTLPAGIMHGPVVQSERQIEWLEYPDGTPFANVVEKPTRKYRRCNPLDIYPAPGARTLDDGDLIERIRLKRSDLRSFIGAPGFDSDSIRLVLSQYGSSGLKEWMINETERMQVEGRPTELGHNQAHTIDCLKFMGSVQGVMLRQWGMSEDDIPDPLLDYEVTAYLIGNYVIKAKLNDHPLGKRNYYSASFDEANDSIWGKGVPQLMEDLQRICNGCARALVNNMGHASGPMAWVYSNRLAAGEQASGIRPWKVWSMVKEASDTGTGAPVGFFQPRSIANELMKVYEYFFKQASEVTGVPAYIYGSNSQSGGSTNTASGLSMLMNAASKGLRSVASNIDNGIIKPSIYQHWLHIMLYEPERARGDVNIVARASNYLLQVEQLQIRRAEALQNTNNPTDMAIIGQEGRAEQLRGMYESLKYDVSKIVPDKEDIAKAQDQAEDMAAFQNIANAIGLPVQQVIQIAQGAELQPGQPGQAPASLAPDGSRAGGIDMATMRAA